MAAASMNSSIDGLIMFDRYLQGQQDKDGFIIDERYNSGGFIPDFFTEKLGRPFLDEGVDRAGLDRLAGVLMSA